MGKDVVKEKYGNPSICMKRSPAKPIRGPYAHLPGGTLYHGRSLG